MMDDQQDARDAAEETNKTRGAIPKDKGDDAYDGKPQEDLDADDLKGFVKDPIEQ